MADENYYDILGVHKDSTEKEITKAYRKKALKCHPDKNPDDPKAAEVFHRLSKALEVLSDPKAKAAFDNVLKAKERVRLRNQALDAKRKKFKQDLEERENSAKEERESEVVIARRLQAEIERLREEGSRLLEEQQELLKSQIKEEKENNSNVQDDKIFTPKLKIKWKSKKSDESNGGYSRELLSSLLGKRMALMNEKGNPENPLTMSWLEEPPSSTESHNASGSSTEACDRVTMATDPTASFPSNCSVSDRDYENITLMRLRQAQERKRIIEQMEKEDSEQENNT